MVTKTRCKVFSIQHYVIKKNRFSPGTPMSSTNKTVRHDITEILLKVALNTIAQTSLTPKDTCFFLFFCLSFVLCPMLSVSLDCPFLIVPSVFSKFYFTTYYVPVYILFQHSAVLMFTNVMISPV